MHRDEIHGPPLSALPGGEPGGGDFEIVLDPAAPASSASDREIDVYADMPAEVESVQVVDVEAEMERVRQAARRHMERLRRERQRRRSGGAAVDLPAGAAPPVLERARLEEARYCIIDLETTGLASGYGDEILEIGAVHLAGGELGREFSTLVNPLRPISAAARAVHGIHDHEVAGAPLLAETLPYLEEMARGRVLVFHNAPFDLGFIQRALCEHGRETLDAPVVDTLVLARRLLAGRCGLGRAAARLGIESVHAHRALADARLTALVLRRLLEVLMEAGADCLADVPGTLAAPARPRQPRRSPPDLLARRLAHAIEGGERLRVAYRLAPGLVPLELQVRPLRLLGGLHLLACDLERGEEILLELTRIEHLSRVS